MNSKKEPTYPIRISEKLYGLINREGTKQETYSGILERLIGTHQEKVKAKQTTKDKEIGRKL